MVADWQVAGLLEVSVLEPVLATIEHGLVVRTLGTLAVGDAKTLRKVVSEVIG